MRGSLRQRRPGSWMLVFDLGHATDPVTGRRRRKQQTLTVHGSKEDAEKRLREVMGDHDKHRFVKPSKTPLIDYLRAWLVTQAPVSKWRPATIRLYRNVIEKHIAKHKIAFRPLEDLVGSHLEGYLASLTDSAAASVAVHRAVLHRALRRAVKDRLLHTNPAANLDGGLGKVDSTVGARAHCWSAFEASRFLLAAQQADAQTSAYMLLALDAGARRSELDGLGWQHVDLEAGIVSFERQLDQPRALAPAADVFGPTKTKRTRTLALGPETIAALMIHKQQQATLKMANRTTYCDFGLVFAKEPIDLQRPDAALGQPLTTLGGSKFAQVVKAAGVPRIKFHGCRHTVASLLLAAGVPVHDVAARLGHTRVTMTLEVYGHARPAERQSAMTLSRLLHAQR